MRLPNGNGSVYKVGKNRRRPYIVVKTIGWEVRTEKSNSWLCQI